MTNLRFGHANKVALDELKLADCVQVPKNLRGKGGARAEGEVD